MSAGMARVISLHRDVDSHMGRCVCAEWSLFQGDGSHADHIADELSKAGYGDIREAAASALRAAAADAHVRGDVGREDRGGVPVEAFLNWRAERPHGTQP